MNNQQINNAETITVANKNKTIKIIASISLVAVILLAVVIIIAVKSQSVNIEDYITDSIEFSGYDGYGKVETNNNDFINYDQLYIDLGIEQNNMVSMFGAESVFYDYIDISTTNGNSQNLKNGDTVTYTFTINYDGINNLNGKKKLKGNDSITKEYEVSGLREVAEINPFDAVEKVIVSEGDYGYSVYIQYVDKIGNYTMYRDQMNTPYNTYYIDTGEEKLEIDFDVPEIESIKNGENITLTLKQDADSYIDKGVIFNSISQDFSVNLTKDLLNSSDITESSYNSLKQKFIECAESREDGTYTFANMFLHTYEESGLFDEKETKSELLALFKYKSDAVGGSEEYVYFEIDNPEILSDKQIVIRDSVTFVMYGVLAKDISSSDDFKDKIIDYYSRYLNSNTISFDEISF